MTDAIFSSTRYLHMIDMEFAIPAIGSTCPLCEAQHQDVLNRLFA